VEVPMMMTTSTSNTNSTSSTNSNEQITMCLLHMLRRGYFDACESVLSSPSVAIITNHENNNNTSNNPETMMLIDDSNNSNTSTNIITATTNITREDVRLCRDAFNVHKSLVETQDPEPAVQWCVEHRWALKRLNSTLEVDLRLQQFLRFVQQGDAIGAVSFARKHLAIHATTHGKVQRGMGSLAFLGLDLGKTPYRDLIGQEGWRNVTDTFRTQIFQVLGLKEELSPLRIGVRAGLSVLITPFCTVKRKSNRHIDGEDNDDTTMMEDVIVSGGGSNTTSATTTTNPSSTTNTNTISSSILQRGEGCPCCDPILSPLASTLPHVKRERSILTCRLSRNRMESDIAVLPNGQAFSRGELERLVIRGTPRGDVIKCPITGEEFLWKDVRRAYVL
jgi:hypothetical protein